MTKEGNFVFELCDHHGGSVAADRHGAGIAAESSHVEFSVLLEETWSCKRLSGQAKVGEWRGLCAPDCGCSSQCTLGGEVCADEWSFRWP